MQQCKYSLCLSICFYRQLLIQHASRNVESVYTQSSYPTHSRLCSVRFDLSDDQLTGFVCPYLPPQVQASFKLYLVHPEIISWMTCWLQKCSKMKGLHKTPRIRNAEFGDDGEHTQMPSASLRISGCPALHQNNEPIS